MKNLLNKLACGVLLLVTGAAIGVRGAEAAEDVAKPAKRQEVLDRARKFLATRELQPITVNPFHSEVFDANASSAGRGAGTTTPAPGAGDAAAGRAVGPRTDRDVLIALAGALKAPNVIVLNGQPVLLFGQKRVKAGGTLNINFEGSEYTVEITAINPPNFTLRLNREEFTRPIK